MSSFLSHILFIYIFSHSVYSPFILSYTHMLLLSVSHCVHIHMLAITCTQSDHVWKSTCTHAQVKSSTHEITELYTLTHTWCTYTFTCTQRNTQSNKPYKPHMHTYTHTYSHTQSHVHIPPLPLIQRYTPTHTQIHSHKHTHTLHPTTHTRTPTHAQAHTNILQYTSLMVSPSTKNSWFLCLHRQTDSLLGVPASPVF